MSGNPTPSWEGEPIDLSELEKPENRGPGYDTPAARAAREGKKDGVITIKLNRLSSVRNIGVDNDK